MTVGEVIGTVFLIAGCVVLGIAVLGVTAMRHPLDRLHYVGVAGFGLLAIAVGVLIQEGFSLIADKALAVAAIVIVTGPVLIHTTARSSRIQARGDWNEGIESHAQAPPGEGAQ